MNCQRVEQAPVSERSTEEREREDRMFRDEEVDERLEELREFDRHPERYR